MAVTQNLRWAHRMLFANSFVIWFKGRYETVVVN